MRLEGVAYVSFRAATRKGPEGDEKGGSTGFLTVCVSCSWPVLMKPLPVAQWLDPDSQAHGKRECPQPKCCVIMLLESGQILD